MELELKNLDITSIVQQALAQSLIKKLDTVLPRMVEQFLSSTASGNRENIVEKAIRAAVEEEICKNITGFLNDYNSTLRRTVREKMAEKFNPEFISDCVVRGMEGIRVWRKSTNGMALLLQPLLWMVSLSTMYGLQSMVLGRTPFLRMAGRLSGILFEEVPR